MRKTSLKKIPQKQKNKTNNNNNKKQTKMLKSQEYSNCLELLSEEWIMGYTEPPNNMLHKAKHTSSRKKKK